MNYKVFYCDTEVAEFETMKEAMDYILSQLKVDSELNSDDFDIYFKLG